MATKRNRFLYTLSYTLLQFSVDILPSSTIKVNKPRQYPYWESYPSRAAQYNTRVQLFHRRSTVFPSLGEKTWSADWQGTHLFAGNQLSYSSADWLVVLIWGNALHGAAPGLQVRRVNGRSAGAASMITWEPRQMDKTAISVSILSHGQQLGARVGTSDTTWSGSH